MKQSHRYVVAIENNLTCNKQRSGTIHYERLGNTFGCRRHVRRYSHSARGAYSDPMGKLDILVQSLTSALLSKIELLGPFECVRINDGNSDKNYALEMPREHP